MSSTATYTPSYPVSRTRPSKSQRVEKVLTKDPVALVREACNRSLFFFIQTFWSEISNDDFLPNWHIEYLCKELEKIAYRVANKEPKEYDLIINIPPGTTKTITCSIMFPVWCWTKWHWMRFITASYSGALALESAEYSRDLVRSPKFRAVYPELIIKDDKDTKSNFKVVKLVPAIGARRQPSVSYGGNRYSTSVSGTLTGYHGHINIVDDPLNPQQALSDVEIEKTNHWVGQTLSSRKTDKKVSTMVTVMQRVHQNDPSGYLLQKKRDKIKLISLPGEIRNFKKHLHPAELEEYYKDELLDPTRLDWEVLKEMELDLGQYGYAGQVGQTPTSPKGGMFKVDRFQLSDVYPKDQIVSMVRYWDKAASDGKGAYTVGVKMARLKNDTFLVVDVKRGQWSTEIRESIIAATADTDGSEVVVYVEQEPGSGGKDSAEATKKRLALRNRTCHADLPTGDKARRADPYSVMVNDNHVTLMRADWNEAFVDEHRYFPKSTFKDQVDAASGAYTKLIGKRKVRSL